MISTWPERVKETNITAELFSHFPAFSTGRQTQQPTASLTAVKHSVHTTYTRSRKERVSSTCRAAAAAAAAAVDYEK